ncbi:hypothetical protein COEREDRAFT_99348 [Coemansia reversa NRRL 1564]|uniref:Transferase n=1 Tax=Coemansia reversa (strain ATCC 12441 / NRRL 1564) TaxID=763665 RepID=A0A2G5B425_COERN|nr:hypothetical protein COEREDRAFT_99348 [Coemansia reversa NRRL 1564]|eukprot:PIA13754.1 hypothetical protein COEREDRAFT_99348 [Coemansia reversa NRRL 1564]
MSDPSFLEKFVRSVRPQVLELDGVDRVSALIYIFFYYFYANNSGSRVDFMPTQLLKDSFFKVLCEFPYLAGVLQRTDDGSLKVVVDMDNLNLPEFKESHSDMHYDDIEASGFSLSMLPKDAATTGIFLINDIKNPAKLASIHIIRFRENTGVMVFASISHALMDGAGYCAFMNRWAEICKHMASGKKPSNLPLRSFSNDRNAMRQCIPRTRLPPGSLIEHSFIPGGIVSKFFAWLSSTTQAKVLALLNKFGQVSHHCYFISHQKLDAIRESAISAAPEKQRLSRNDILMSLLSIAVANSENTVNDTEQSTGIFQCIKNSISLALTSKSKVFESSMPIDIRSRIGGMKTMDYCGNAIVLQRVQNPIDMLQGSITSEMIAKVASTIRLATDSVDHQYISNYFKAVNAEPDCFIRATFYGTAPPAKLIASNHTRLAHYQIDFGWGIPAWANPLEAAAPNLCYVLPAHPSKDGIVVHFMASEESLAQIQKLPIWQDTFEFIH